MAPAKKVAKKPTAKPGDVQSSARDIVAWVGLKGERGERRRAQIPNVLLSGLIVVLSDVLPSAAKTCEGWRK